MKKQKRINPWKGSRQTMSKGGFVIMAVIGVAIIGLMLGMQLWMNGETGAECPLEISEVMTGNGFSLILDDGTALVGDMPLYSALAAIEDETVINSYKTILSHGIKHLCYGHAVREDV